MAKATGGSKKASAKKAVTKTSSKKTTAKKASSSAKGKARAEADAPKGAAQAASASEGVQLPATSGKIGVFGGPKDRGYKPDDKLSLPTGPHFAYERAHTLNPKSYYCMMRWDYHVQHRSPEEGKRWWANKKLVVTNAKTGNAVIVRAVDYGPHETSGLAISVSPGAAEAIGVEVGDEVEIAFADQKAPLGPIK